MPNRHNSLTLIALSAIIATGCVGSPDDYSTEEAWREYCASNGYQADRRTGVTVQSWDPDATTAGHRGTHLNQTLPRGC